MKVLKKLYDAVPFKRTLFSALKTVWSPGENIYRHLHFKGIFEVTVDREASFRIKHHGFLIENEVFWSGLEKGHEKVSYDLWKKLVRNSRVILDVGANTGIYSLIANALNPEAKIFAFEPVKRVFEKLEENRRLNGFGFMPIEKALSNYDGDAVIFDTEAEHTYSVTVNKNLKSADRMIETAIRVERLDTFIEVAGLDGIDLMKVDVETHEPEVLEGMGEYLRKFAPPMLIEILTDEIGQKVEDLVSNNGYYYFNIDERAGSIRKVEHIGKSDQWNYLLCSPDTAKQLGLV